MPPSASASASAPELDMKAAHDPANPGGASKKPEDDDEDHGGISFMDRLWQEHKRMNPYGEPTYWDERYEQGRKEHGQNYSFDWYVGPDKIANVLELHIGENRGKRILVLGCGNSRLSEVLFDLGYRNIVSVDTSAVVVSQMQFRYIDREGMEFMVGDAMKLDTFPDCSFDVIVDKGCIDCIFCSYRSIDNALLAYREACRLLTPGTGIFLSVSYGTQDMRSPHMKQFRWDVEVGPVAYSHGISLYVASKFPDATGKGKLKALLKYGSLMSSNTSKDKWKAQTNQKMSTQTKHADTVAKLALQGVTVLTPAQEAELHLDPNNAFRIEDVSKAVAAGVADIKAAEGEGAAVRAQEEIAILAGKENAVAEDAPTDLAGAMKFALGKKKENDQFEPGGKTKSSAVWKLAKKSAEATKGQVFDDDARVKANLLPDDGADED